MTERVTGAGFDRGALNGGLRALMALSLLLSPAAARADCQLNEIFELPIKMVGTDAIVTAKIDGAPATFAIDTGAFSNLLTPAADKRFKLFTDLEPSMVSEGINGDFLLYRTVVPALSLGGFAFKNVPFVVGGADLGGADGLLGQDLLGAGDVDYDYRAGVVRFFRPDGCGDAPLAYWLKPGEGFDVVAFRSSDPVSKDITAEAVVNGVRLRVVFDTGGGASMLSLAAARRLGITPQSPGVRATAAIGGLGREKLAAWAAPIQTFEIGGETVRNTHLLVADWTGAGHNYADMILGGDFFASHHVLIANSQHKVYFTYNGGPVFASAP